MEVCALASGSSGNCFYIGNEKSKSGILIDAGLSCKRIVERLSAIGKKAESIKAIFITHEHSDHIRGADVFARTFKIPIYATGKTIDNSMLCCNEKLIRTISNNETLKIIGLQIEAFSKFHRAADPVAYTISNRKRISIITDLGMCCENAVSHVKDSNVLFLESNHDLEMLENGPYPYFLKKWVKSDNGHLSNNQASLCILEHATKKLQHIFLSHLSSTNNTPEIALKTLNSLIKERKDLFPKISVSFKDRPTELIRIKK